MRARPGAQVKLIDSGRYFFAFDADVAPDGTVYFGEVGLQYSAAATGHDPARHDR